MTTGAAWAQHAEVIEHGRVLLAGSESRITLAEPFLLAAISESAILDHTIGRITTFAFILIGVIGTLVALGAAPPLLGAVVAVWLIGAIVARGYARSRRRQHGRFLLDFDAGQLRAQLANGESVEVTTSALEVRTESSADSEAPIWLLCRTPNRTFRLARGTAPDIDRVLTLFRRYRVPVHRGHETESEPSDRAG